MQTIVILGGGFGGIRCALDLEKKLKNKANIILIEKNSAHLFTPALYEVASAYPINDDPYQLHLRKAVAIPYDQIFDGKNINIIHSEIAGIDINSKHVVMSGGEKTDFDHLVIGLGSQYADFGVSGVNEYAYRFKTTDDAIALHKKLESLLRDVHQGLRQPPVKLLIIGAGFTGIELAAELRTCGRKLSIKYGLSPQSVSVVLFEAASSILPMVSNAERKIIVERLTKLGVVIMENSSIESVLSDSVKLKDGRIINGSAVVWTAGVRPNILVSSIHGMSLTPKGKIVVDEFLRVEDQEDIYALGDVAEFIDPKTQKPIPGLAYIAHDQGSLVAHNIIAKIKGQKLKIFKLTHNSWVAPVGGKFAVAHIDPLGTFSGYLGWIVRLLVDLRYFLSILPPGKAFKLFQRDVMLFSKND